uniref:Uncharacterized protein n=1 Tax=Arundo donax TaxID=35708 RepID=A0A0A9AWS1_ARUDO
MVWFLFLSS